MNEKQDNPPKYTEAMITDDLAESLPLGGKIEFRSRPFPISNASQLTWVTNWDYFEGAVIAIYTVINGNHEVLGSGFMIGPGIAITAKHTFDDYLDDIPKGNFAGLCIGVAAHGVVLWRIKTITNFDNTDVSIIGLTAASEGLELCTSVALSTRCPSIGEKVTLVGFRREQLIRNEKKPELVFKGNMYCATGTIKAQFPTGRDTVMMPWPTLEVSSHSLGAMSGGPVIDRNGLVVGLVSSGFDSEEHNGPTYVSLLWPVMAQKFRPVWPKGLFDSTVSLLEIDSRLVSIDKREAVSRDPDTGHIQYKIWS